MARELSDLPTGAPVVIICDVGWGGGPWDGVSTTDDLDVITNTGESGRLLIRKGTIGSYVGPDDEGASVVRCQDARDRENVDGWFVKNECIAMVEPADLSTPEKVEQWLNT